MTAIEHHGAGHDQGFKAALLQLQTLLVSGETLAATTIQHRLYALLNRRSILAATTGRFIFMRRRLFGGYDPTSFRWQDIKDVWITVGMFTATLGISYSADLSDTAKDEGNFTRIVMKGLRIPEAQSVYRCCQEQEQAWREKRRLRAIEEMRAQSGGTQIATVIPQSGMPVSSLQIDAGHPPSQDSPSERLAVAKEMLSKGLIADSEYETIKARIIATL
jgi:hypothetical protein